MVQQIGDAGLIVLVDFEGELLRELIGDLERAGFTNRGGKGDHRNYSHPNGGRVTLSGQLGDDARPYQEREVRRAIEEAQS